MQHAYGFGFKRYYIHKGDNGSFFVPVIIKTEMKMPHFSPIIPGFRISESVKNPDFLFGGKIRIETPSYRMVRGRSAQF